MTNDSNSNTSVDHPPHYNAGGPIEPDGTSKYEAIKVIEDWGLGFSLGNALKYILRAPHKGSEILDLDKAIWYLERVVHARDGSISPVVECKKALPPSNVAAAWGLPHLLAMCLVHLYNHEPKPALSRLSEYLEEMRNLQAGL